MAQELTTPREDASSNTAAQRNRLKTSLKLGPLQADVDIDVTPTGLVAIGALVSAILLSVVPIVYVATRKLPPAD